MDLEKKIPGRSPEARAAVKTFLWITMPIVGLTSWVLIWQFIDALAHANQNIAAPGTIGGAFVIVGGFFGIRLLYRHLLQKEKRKDTYKW